MIGKPQDRRQALEPVIAAVGGKLYGFWYAFGATDGYVLADFPSGVVAASALAKVAASGAFASLSTTKLLTVEEMLEALHDAGGDPAPSRPPSVPSLSWFVYLPRLTHSDRAVSSPDRHAMYTDR
jgi:uncharacterized protein with GYD domain